MYSDSIYPTVFPAVLDSFLFGTQDSTGLNSSSAEFVLSLLLSTVPYAPCVVLASSYSSQWFTNRTCDDSLLFLYTFEEAQLNSSAAQTQDISWQQLLGPLMMNPNAVPASSWLSGQSGVQLHGAANVIALTSARTAATVYQQVRAAHRESFCLESWIQQDDSAAQQYSVVLGFTTAAGVTPTTPDCSDGMDVALLQQQSSVAMRTPDVGGGCVVPPGTLGSGLHHVVGCVDGVSETVATYVDGSLVAGGGISAGYTAAWNGSAQLVVAPESDDLVVSGPTWRGFVYLMSMYSRALSAAEVQANYLAGLPNNLPVPTLLTQYVTANASTNSSLTLASLSLAATDVDQQLMLQSPYSSWIQPQSITLFITALPTPSKGNLSILFLTNPPSPPQLTLSSSMLPYALPHDNSTYSLWFLSGALSASQLLLPAYSVISSFASFQVTPSDGYAYGLTATVYVDLLTQPALTNTSTRASNVSAVFFQFASPRVSSGLLALYTFTEGASAPTSLQSADQSGVNVLGNMTLSSDPLSAAWTSGRAGLHLNGTGSQTRAISALTVSTLSSLLSTYRAYTMEMWFSPSNGTQGLIFGLGSWSAKQLDASTCYSGSAVVYDLAVYGSQSAGVSTSIAGGSLTSLQCITSTVPAPSKSSLYHFALTVNSTRVVTFLNSASSISATAASNLSVWTSSMQLFFGQTATSAVPTRSWAGDVFLFSIYNRSLSSAEVQQNYAAGTVQSIPVALPASTWLVLISSANAVALSTLSPPLPNLTSSNFDFSTYANVSVYITQLPAHGTLSATQQGAALVVPYKLAAEQQLWYRSTAGHHGVDQFLFRVSASTARAIVRCYCSSLTLSVPAAVGEHISLHTELSWRG